MAKVERRYPVQPEIVITMSDAEANDIKQKAGDEGGSTNNPEGQPEDGGKAADKENGGEAGGGGEQEAPTVNAFDSKEYQDKIATQTRAAQEPDDTTNGKLYSLGNGYYSTTDGGPAEFKDTKSISEQKQLTMDGDVVDVVPLNTDEVATANEAELNTFFKKVFSVTRYNSNTNLFSFNDNITHLVLAMF